MTLGAWGQWGAEDERGALNFVGSEQVRQAVGLVRSGRVISLAQPLSERTPVPGHRASMQHFMGRDGGDYAAGGKRPGGFQFAEDTVVLPLHFGTHIDALCHAWYDDKLYNGFPIERNPQHDRRGALRHRQDGANRRARRAARCRCSGRRPAAARRGSHARDA